MSGETRFTVIGAGHGGKAVAAHLALMGFPVTLYNRTWENVAAIDKRGGIRLRSHKGGPDGFGKLSLVTSDLGEALKEADVIMVVVPSTAQRDIARKAARHLRSGQIIVLNPGRVCGAIEFAKVLADLSCEADVSVAEAQSFIYLSRSEGPTEARILRIHDAVPLAALPATRTARVLEALNPAYPQFIDGVSVLHTGLNNAWSVLHPGLMLLNAGRIESTLGDFRLYVDGVTTAVARLLEILDAERVAVATALDVSVQTAVQWLRMSYEVVAESLMQATHQNPAYRDVKAPRTMNHRYLSEDVPMCLVPISGLGRRHGVSVKGIDGIIRLACMIQGTDYRRRGRRLHRLGIARLSASELKRYVDEGVLYGTAA
ncbi:MAG: NAD(P)-binding domain-containing protein [Anaerolineae bacterium]|nr:NAD(P)-binding domain-containing protein [Anaerolineae bacterium]NIN95832.1 NAD(P)-binding domain-containing protein [Anaerolineae bacterium]NIQ78798.1 NAD(P)-binding domain-containing protein [Anaerolineae bacterium]